MKNHFVFAAVAGSAYAQQACSVGLQALLAPLTAYAPALDFCAKRFPRAPVTSTVLTTSTSTAQQALTTTTSEITETVTSTITVTTTLAGVVNKRDLRRNIVARQASSTSPAAAAAANRQQSTPNPREKLFSSLIQQASAVARTFCSCAQKSVRTVLTTSTALATITPTSTLTVTSTKTATSFSTTTATALIPPQGNQCSAPQIAVCENLNVGYCRCGIRAANGRAICFLGYYNDKPCSSDAQCASISSRSVCVDPSIFTNTAPAGFFCTIDETTASEYRGCDVRNPGLVGPPVLQT